METRFIQMTYFERVRIDPCMSLIIYFLSTSIFNILMLQSQSLSKKTISFDFSVADFVNYIVIFYE